MSKHLSPPFPRLPRLRSPPPLFFFCPRLHTDLIPTPLGRQRAVQELGTVSPRASPAPHGFILLLKMPEQGHHQLFRPEVLTPVGYLHRFPNKLANAVAHPGSLCYETPSFMLNVLSLPGLLHQSVTPSEPFFAFELHLLTGKSKPV